MGDPRKLRRRYEGPSHPWQLERITVEKELVREYGLKNKRELYKINTRIKNFTSIAKRLIASSGEQTILETQQLFAKLHKLGLVAGSTILDDVLGLQPKALLERRLQTILFRKGLARSVKQSRQFISHEHVMVGSSKITSPGYLVAVDEEASISVDPTSSLASPDHPERVPIQKKARKPRREPRRER